MSTRTWVVTMGVGATAIEHPSFHAHAVRGEAPMPFYGALRPFHAPAWASPGGGLPAPVHARPHLTGAQTGQARPYQCGYSTLALVLAGLAGLALGGFLGFSIANSVQAGTAFGLWTLGATKSLQKAGETIAGLGAK